MITLALLIPAFPLVAYLIQAFVGKRLPRMGDWVSVSAIFVSFICASIIFANMWSNFDPNWVVTAHWTWLDSGTAAHPFKLELGVRLDNLAAVMLFMVTLCATLIHLFSTGYMRDYDGKESDGYRYASFFAFLSLFTSAMLALVISDNLFTLFMFWEVMGLCSYLLIGFYRHKPSAANASIKAFMTTRIGDTLLFIGMLALFTQIGSFRFDDIYAAIEQGAFGGETLGFATATFIGFLIFCGTVGKSAQFPLQVWLPDAMEGPTPVSALIHAATMVAAGVYLIIRTFPLLELGGVLPLIAYVGAFTSLFAAILAIKQFDIKKVLAYSTLSQLGYMVLAVGVGAYTASFMHLITHAIFKACLFMASGAVIYAMHHEQDMRKMGDLRKRLPITYKAMLVATLAISGVPLFSGFVSKDAILVSALAYGGFEHPEHMFLPIAGFLTAGLTAFYMFRLMFMTFFGEAGDKKHVEHAHEVPWNMWLPLVVLAGLSLSVLFSGSVTGGLLGHGDFVLGGGNEWFVKLIKAPVVKVDEHFEHLLHQAHLPGMIASVVLATLGIVFSWLVYKSKTIPAEKLAKLWPNFVHKAIDNLYYFDWLYKDVFIKRVFLPFSRLMARFDDLIIDRILVDGWKDVNAVVKTFIGKFDDTVIDEVLVDGVGGSVPQYLGASLRTLQNGKIQRYLMVAAVALLTIYLLIGVL
ncbi:NADH-quinone oxidoreductase subunit L [bacterium]|nr:NADH-quinone oxidoreductase subunit L [bacterium]